MAASSLSEDDDEEKKKRLVAAVVVLGTMCAMQKTSSGASLSVRNNTASIDSLGDAEAWNKFGCRK